MIFLFTVNLPSALALYWLVSGAVALVQQTMLLREDTDEMEAEVATKADRQSAADQKAAKAIEAEVVSPKPVKKPKKGKSGKAKRRR